MTTAKTNAGYKIIAESSKQTAEGTAGVVLAYKDKQYIGREFVTWEFNEFPGEARSYFWGHYTCNEQAAREDFNDRAARMFGRC